MEVFMITLYKYNETDFTHDGIGILKDTISCIVERELNGNWFLNLEYLLQGNKAEFIKEHCVLKVPTPSGLQLFRIKEIEKDMESINVYAEHIFFDLAKNFIRDTNIVAKTRSEAIKQILNNTLNPHRFKYVGTDNNTTQKNLRIVRKDGVSAILGSEDNTVVNRYGGEIDIDNFNISSKDQIGKNTNLVIEYAKNMTGILETVDMSEVATRIVPQGANELLLPEYFIDSPYVGSYYQPLVAHMEFSEVEVVNKEQATADKPEFSQEQAYAELRRLVKELYDNGIDKPNYTYDISFIDLSNTVEYKSFKDMFSLNLGDIVRVRHRDMNLDLDCRIRNYRYNSLINEFENLQVGTIKKSISLNIQKVQAEVISTKEDLSLKVNNVNNNLQSSITQTAKEIRQEVTDADNKLQTQVTTTANDFNILAGKYNNGQLVGTNYNFSGTGFTIGATDGSTTATHTSSFSEWRHGNSSSRADATGFSRDGHPYTHLIEMGTGIVGGAIGTHPKVLTIQLSDVWKRKNFKVLVSMKNTSGGIADEWVKRTFLEVVSIDTVNATFNVRGYWTSITSTGVENEKELEFSWLAIGG
jgi:phage minor structural protein